MNRGLLIAAGALALAFPSAALAGGPTMAVGATEELVRQTDPALSKANMDLARLAGLDTIRVTQFWAPGETRPSAEDMTELRNVVLSARLTGMRPYVSVANFGSRTTPLTPEARAAFAEYTASIARALPTVKDFIIGNEPNLNRFWLPQFNEDGTSAAPAAYLALLATTYDALKAVSSDISVVGGAVSPRGTDRPDGLRPTHSPTTFIPAMGAAYRASGRTTPIMDVFGFHPYTDNSSQPPTFQHPNSSTVAIADYGKLIALLGQAFDGSPQRGSTLPILYDEFGVESVIPAEKSSFYSGVEPDTTRPVDEATQGDYYRQALGLAFCQPNVVGILMFHVFDETGLPAWQSGLYYADGTPKTSLPTVRTAAGFIRRGIIARCPDLKLTVDATISRLQNTATRRGFLLACDLDCSYTARIQRLPGRSTVRTVSGRAGARRSTWVLFPPRLAAGSYRFTLSAVHPVNPGPTTVVSSSRFVVKPR